MAEEQDLTDSLLRRLKNRPVIAALVVAGAIVIAVASVGESLEKLLGWFRPSNSHDSAAPPEPSPSLAPLPSQAAPAPSPGPDLVLRPTKTNDESAAILSALRTTHDLRPLAITEAGLPLRRSPAGTFFTVWSSYVDFDPAFDNSLLDARIDMHVRPTGIAFEAHHRVGQGPVLIAFVGQDSAARLTSLDGRQTVEVLASPVRFDPFVVLAQLPVERLVAAKNRSIFGDGWILEAIDFEVK